jgi:hypothetical protein
MNLLKKTQQQSKPQCIIDLPRQARASCHTSTAYPPLRHVTNMLLTRMRCACQKVFGCRGCSVAQQQQQQHSKWLLHAVHAWCASSRQQTTHWEHHTAPTNCHAKCFSIVLEPRSACVLRCRHHSQPCRQPQAAGCHVQPRQTGLESHRDTN